MAKVVELVRKLLSTEHEKLFYNNSEKDYVKAVSILICNTSNAAQLVYIVFGNQKGNTDLAGANLYGLSVDANETVCLPDRILGPGNTIIGWSDTPDVISFTADIINNE